VSVAVTGALRVERAFARAREEDRLALIVYLTVGHPDRASPERPRTDVASVFQARWSRRSRLTLSMPGR